MTDRTTDALQRTMKAIVQSAPEAPDIPDAGASQRVRRHSPLLAAGGAFALVMLLGVVAFIVSGLEPDRGQLVGPFLDTPTTLPVDDGAVQSSTSSAPSGVEPAEDTTPLLGPDPEQVARVMEDFAPMVGTVHPMGWRIDLQAEQAKCLLPGADAFVQEMLVGGPASNFPLQESLTASHLAIACTDDNNYASENGYTSADATVCVSYAGRYPVPTVVIDGSECASAGDDLRPITDEDLAELNHMRAVEVALLAVPSDAGCPTFSQARDWVNQQISQLGIDVTVVESDEGTGVCYRGSVVWEIDQVFITSIGPGPQSSG